MANGERTKSSPEPQTKQDLDHIPSHGNIAGLPALKNVWWTDWRDPNMIWENVSLFSRSSEQDYNNPPARFVSCPPLVIYWGFLQGEKVMADLLLVFHINYIRVRSRDGHRYSPELHRSISIDQQYLDVWQHLTPETLGSLSDDSVQKWCCLWNNFPQNR